MPYAFRFSGNAAYPYKPGSLFLGVDPARSYEVGIQTERHAITIAGSRAGKGAAIIIPNLLRWPHNAIVIDPKGEAAERTAEARERMGQAVHVLDPFRVAAVPDRFRAKLNPLAGFKRDALDAREDINVMADGLVLRSDPRSDHWYGGGLAVLAGMIAYLLDQAPGATCTLPELRFLLTMPEDKFKRLIQEMQNNRSFGNLPAAGASRLTTSEKEGQYFKSVADDATKWLDSPAVADLMSASTFSLADLKTKPCTVYLVLPSHLMGEHGRFLRLFVRMALNVMAKGGVKGGRRCLFLLDEFYSLGKIDEIAKAAGLMPGYGVTLVPILQDLGQLESLYGRDGMHTFFGNSDAHIFFGNTDAPTLDYVSARIGRISPGEIPIPPEKSSLYTVFPPKDKLAVTLADIDAENEMRRYRHESAGLGGARVPPELVRSWVMKGDGDAVARSMIVFARGNDVLNVRPAPYFLNFDVLRRKTKKGSEFKRFFRNLGLAITALLLFLLIVAIVNRP